jgi:hypothetical protein
MARPQILDLGRRVHLGVSLARPEPKYGMPFYVQVPGASSTELPPIRELVSEDPRTMSAKRPFHLGTSRRDASVLE